MHGDPKEEQGIAKGELSSKIATTTT